MGRSVGIVDYGLSDISSVVRVPVALGAVGIGAPQLLVKVCRRKN